MSKAEQSKAAQKLKTRLKNLGVQKRFQVDQGVGYDSIVMWVYSGKFQDDDKSLKIHFDSTGYIVRLTHDEDTTILDDPTDQEMADYINTKHWYE